MGDIYPTIEIGPPGQYGKCKVTARLGKNVHHHTFDPFDQSQRRQFRDAVISKFEFPDDAHEYLEAKIICAAEAEPAAIFRPVVTMLNTVEPIETKWLWPKRVVIGKNNLLCGNPGCGKSLTALDFAARVSRDAVFPDGSRSSYGPAGVVILTMEDDAADTIVPRLIAHNADLSRIALVQGLTETDSDGSVIKGIDLAIDIQSLRAAAEQVENCRLVIIDTIADYIGGKTDTDKNKDVRSVLNPLAAMASELQVANLCIAHFRKSEGSAIHATMGSVGFVGQPRVAWAITKCPKNPKRRLMTCIKNNLADDTSGLGFAIESYGPDGGPVLAWEAEPVRMSADEAMAQLRKAPGPKRDTLNAAASWLSLLLASGPKLASDVLEAADVAGYKPWTVRKAFTQLECTRRKNGFNDGWIWALPEDESEDEAEHTGQEISDLRNLRVNTEEKNINGITNSFLPAKVTNSEHGEDGATFEELDDERDDVAMFEAERLAIQNEGVDEEAPW